MVYDKYSSYPSWESVFCGKKKEADCVITVSCSRRLNDMKRHCSYVLVGITN